MIRTVPSFTAMHTLSNPGTVVFLSIHFVGRIPGARIVFKLCIRIAFECKLSSEWLEFLCVFLAAFLYYIQGKRLGTYDSTSVPLLFVPEVEFVMLSRPLWLERLKRQGDKIGLK